MRHLCAGGENGREGLHLAGNQAKARVLAVFIALVKEKLHAKADAHERLALSGKVAQQRIQPEGMKFFRRIAKGPHARQNDAVRRAQRVFLACDGALRADMSERAGERIEVAHPVIHHGDHGASPPSVPLVEGISPAAAGSISQASRRARATALKMPSMM